MTNHPTITILDPKRTKCQEAIPVARQLEALFNTIPEEELLKALKVYYAGRPGWRILGYAVTASERLVNYYYPESESYSPMVLPLPVQQAVGCQMGEPHRNLE